MIDIRLVPPSVWRPEVARYGEARSAIDPWSDPARLAHATLWVLQDAHVGITPRLAHELGRLFARRGPDAGVWSKLVLIPKGEHGGDAFDEQQYKEMIDAFLDEKLRGPLTTETPKRRRAVGRN